MAGELYEMKLAALLFIRCLMEGHPFKIATNMNAAGSFDDIVISLNNEVPILMQLKHRSSQGKAVYDNQFTQLKGDFTLLKYCETYWTLKSQWEDDLASCGLFEKCVFVLYTNARVACVRQTRNKRNTKPKDHNVKMEAINTWQNMLNTGGSFCPIQRDTHSNIYKAFEDIPNFKRILKERNNAEEVLNVVRALGNKDAKEVPPDTELDRLAADLEKLKGVECYEEFLPRVWIFGGQASEQKLNSLIENDLTRLLGIESSKSVANTLLESVQRWWQYDNHFLNEDSRLWQEILQTRWEFLSSSIKNKLIKFPIEFEQQEIDIMKQALSKSAKVIHILASDSPVLSCLKVLECLNQRTCIIVDRETFERYQNELTSYSKYNIILVLFSEDDDFVAFMKAIDETKLKVGKWKVIIVSKYQHTFETIRDSCNLAQLATKSRELVLIKCVSFQGLEIRLQGIIGKDEKMLSVVSGDIITQLLAENNKLLVGNVPTKVIEYFINRTLQRKDKIGKEILEENAVFAISNTNNLRQLVPTGEKVRKFKSGDAIELSCRFYEIGDAADFEDLSKSFKSIHWLQRNDDTFHWVQSKGNIHAVKRYIARGATASSCNNMFSLSERLIVLVAEPGMGKSTLMSYVALEMKKLKCTNWVIKVNLNDFAEYLGQETASPLGLLERAVKVHDDFQKDLLQQSIYVIGNIAVLLDGFDEVSPDYADQVIRIMQQLLAETRIQQIWVTSRPVMKETLEETFCTLSYILKPFSVEDQKAFLHKFWNVGYIEEFANRLLELTGRWLNDKLGQFTGIPLQTMMLAEAFKEEMLHFKNTGENSLPEKLDLLQLYEKFIDTKLKIYFREKLNVDMYNVGMKALSESVRKDFYDKHMVSAILSLFSQEELSKLSVLQNLKDRVKDFFLGVQLGKEKTGIIMTVNNERPTFIHRTFEEYFAALWLMGNHKNLLGLVEQVLFSPTYEIMRIFFDRALTRDCILHVAVLNQDIDSMKELLSDQITCKSIDKGNRTALHLAVMNYSNRISERSLKQKRRSILQEIIDSGGDLNSYDSLMRWTPIQYANRLKAWEAMELLIEAGADTQVLNAPMSQLDVKEFCSKVLPVLLRKNYLNIVKCYFSINPNAANSIFPVNHEFQTVMFSPLHEAARWGHLDLVQLLLDAGAEMEYVDTLCKETPLMWAARSNKWRIVKLLLDKGAKGNIQSERDGVSVLQLAAESGDEKLVELLLMKHGLIEQINCTAANGATPLLRAAKLKRWNVAKLLIEKGANTACTLPNGLTPLHLAVKSGEENMVALILHNEEVRGRINAKVRGKGEDTILMTAARAGFWSIVQQLVKFGAKSPSVAHLVATFGKDSAALSLLNTSEVLKEINDLNEVGHTPLMQAAKSKNWEMFKEILKHGGRVAPGSKDSALHLAISSSSVSVVQVVLDNADDESVDLVNGHQTKAFLSALSNGMFDVSELLISEYPELLHTSTKDGSTVLHLAAESGNVDLLEYLLLDMDLVEKIDYVDNKGETPLFRAMLRGNFEAALLLVDQGADVTKTNNRGETLAHAAARKGSLEVGEWLIDVEMNPMQADEHGITPLHVACNSCRFAYVQWLVSKINAPVNVCDNLNRPPIAFAVGQYSSDITGLLIQHGAEVNYRSQDGKTLLHIAAHDWRIVKQLLETDAIYPDVKDNHGRTPLHLAIQSISLESVKILLQAGANPAVKDNDGATPLDLLTNESFKDGRKKHKVHTLMKMFQKK